MENLWQNVNKEKTEPNLMTIVCINITHCPTTLTEQETDRRLIRICRRPTWCWSLVWFCWKFDGLLLFQILPRKWDFINIFVSQFFKWTCFFHQIRPRCMYQGQTYVK